MSLGERPACSGQVRDKGHVPKEMVCGITEQKERGAPGRKVIWGLDISQVFPQSHEAQDAIQ